MIKLLIEETKLSNVSTNPSIILTPNGEAKAEYETKSFNFNLPTSIAEIDHIWLKAITDSIKPADNYSLIGIVSFVSLTEMISIKKAKNVNIGAIPIFIKAGTTDDNAFVNKLDFGCTILTDSSSVSTGIHVNVAQNTLSFNKILSTLNRDNNINSKIIGKNFAPITVLEFKLLPNCSIYGTFDTLNAVGNPYIEIVK